jgi:hypothetical protein
MGASFRKKQQKVEIMRRLAALNVIALAGGLLFQSGCAEQKPKPVTNVSPPVAGKATDGAPPETRPKDDSKPAGDEAKAPAEDTRPAEDTKPAAPPDAGSTTGGGTDETPSKSGGE